MHMPRCQSFPAMILKQSSVKNMLATSMSRSAIQKFKITAFELRNLDYVTLRFFESRTSPLDAPLILWLSGGPGCSSTFSLLFEMGPCRITNQGNDTTINPYSWNQNANIIFLDQPVNTGFSYADSGKTVGNTPDAGRDVYAFLQLFLNRYPEYAKAPFHIASESYGGVFAPNFAKIIFEENEKLVLSHSHLKRINLSSIIIANGLTDPYLQMGSVAEYVCEGPYPIFEADGVQCASLRHETIPICQRLIQDCYKFNSKKACAPAHKYCYTHVWGSLFESGRNVYDARQVCDRGKTNGGHGCYEEAAWIDFWMNATANKAALGAKLDKPVVSCNMNIAKEFLKNGDGMHHTALLLPDLVNADVRLLVYAGDADMICNYMGIERWVDSLETKFSSEFRKSQPTPWYTARSGQLAGEVRSAGGQDSGAGSFAFVKVNSYIKTTMFPSPLANLKLPFRFPSLHSQIIASSRTMRLWLFLFVVYVTFCRAAPPTVGVGDSQIVFDTPFSPPVKDDWFQAGLEHIKQDGLIYELVTHPDFVEYQLRVTEPQLCDPSVKQYSGYLDISTDKHLFFWLFESRTAPADAPLILWLNGGPGCSSSFGLLFELGPCTVVDEGNTVVHNPLSWNKNANILFLDQPVNVGYSYSDHGEKVSTTPDSAKDVYAFLQLFFNRYPEYSRVPFHIAAESYGGVYAPNIASVIHQENKKLEHAPKPHSKHIHLESVVLGNGLTDPYTQMGSTADYVCNGPYPILDPDNPECVALRRTKIPICQRLIKACYAFQSRLTCTPAELYCYSQVWGVFEKTGRNMYDARLKCDRAEDKDGPLCYKQTAWVDKWMNDPEHKIALGVSPQRNFTSCNLDVNVEFLVRGDGMYPTYRLLPELVNSGIRLLVYSGNADMMCNYMGEEQWVNNLDTKFKDEFQNTKSLPWILEDDGRIVGEVRSAGGSDSRAGNVTFVTVYEAGHMVPYDQPEAALVRFTISPPAF
ncbi:hypothetical protein CVT24_004583 [Panaeolus cyanescens]|uniref:Carboxypeptidase n=1 Tax=Panaeolus cyanescens TaxID=181874 RepID=A0A409W1C2_9AGAR|nr:hypothetical protein CVT24_004583 [Panaeolus cyanescens]